MVYALHEARLATPIGDVVIEGDSTQLSGIRIEAGGSAPERRPNDGAVAKAAAQIAAYFAGTLTAFDVALAPAKSVRGEALRAAIASVPYGATMTYGTLARLNDSGAQAMGQACARNPFPIIIPCHRVTSSGGAAEHYSAGDGPATKAWLIDHEARHRAPSPSS